MSKEIGIAMKNGQDTTAIQAEVKKMGEEISALEEQERDLNEKQQNLIVFYTNLIMLDENNRLSQIDNCNVSNYREIQINSAPTLLVVYQGTCINQVEGYQNIISFLNS